LPGGGQELIERCPMISGQAVPVRW